METDQPNSQRHMFSFIEQWKASGKTQKQFCLEHGMSYHKFHYWLRKYHRQLSASAFVSLSLPAVHTGHVEVGYPDGRRVILHQAVDVLFLHMPEKTSPPPSPV